MTADPSTFQSRPWLQKYPAGIPADLEVPNQSLFDLIGESVEKHADRTALIYYGAKWTYRKFWEQAGHVAAAFREEGLAKGDRVALYLPNCPVYPIAFYAALRIGLVVVQASPLYIGQDLERLLADSDPKAIVALDVHYANLARLASRRKLPRVFVAQLKELYPFPQRFFVNAVLRRRGITPTVPDREQGRSWATALQAPNVPAPVPVDPARDVAVFQYTGGTTGVPKAAMLTHRNLVANILQCHLWLGATTLEPQVYLGVVPFFHVYGMTLALNQPLYEGASIVLETRPDVNEILKLIDRYHPTYFHGVPSLYNAINQHPNRANYDLSSIRICASGSAPLPREVAKKFEELTGGNLVEGYGLSETSPVTHANPVQGERRPGSVGLPLPGTEQKVVDLGTGVAELPVSQPGELCVKGPQVMLGYYHQPEETSRVIKDGWFHTGDIAYLDADGYCYIVDRLKDIVIVGGLNVYPREVEEVLFQHPDVADAAAIGVPDDRLGEVVKAFVVRKPGATVSEEQLIAFIRERIAHFKAPRSVEFRAALPRSGVQKVLRRELRTPIATPVEPTATVLAR